MQKLIRIIPSLLLISLFFLVIGCSTHENPKTKSINTISTTLNISAAASLKDSLEEVQQLYLKENPGIKVTYNFGSSGALQQQIEQGADADIFISASQKQMDVLENKNLIIKDSRKNLLQNDVVLIVPKDNSDIGGFNDLTSNKIKRIALGEPKSVPAGQYSEEVFIKLGILDKIKPKAVYGKDVKEVLTWVETGNADAGIVYSTDAKISSKVKTVSIAPADSHSPVNYPAAVITDSKKIDAAKDFMKFLSNEKSKAIFEKFGFRVNIE